jgi:alpha-D-xyloside xylohydrolase
MEKIFGILALSPVLMGQAFAQFRTDADIVKWGLAVDADTNEYFTGLMERVVDGPQQNSWATNLTAAMNLRGQKVDMFVRPTTVTSGH